MQLVQSACWRVVKEENEDYIRNTGKRHNPTSTLTSTMSRDLPLLFVQAAEQAEALYYPASLHDLIVFTLELPLIECIQDEKGAILAHVTAHFTIRDAWLGVQSACASSSVWLTTWSKALSAAGETSCMSHNACFCDVIVNFGNKNHVKC
jgi:hypothetical protein